MKLKKVKIKNWNKLVVVERYARVKPVESEDMLSAALVDHTAVLVDAVVVYVFLVATTPIFLLRLKA